jgi:DNA-binding MarR family transcriptional regulator
MTEPILSVELATQYRNLPDNYQRLFHKLFREMFDYLLPISKYTAHGGVLFNYWLVNLLRQKLGLTVKELDLLTLLYYHSSGGRGTIRSDRVKVQFPDLSSRTFLALRQKGYITRHTWDPHNQNYHNGRSHRPIFICLTPKSIKVIRDLEGDLRSYIFKTIRLDLTSSL